MSHGWQPGVNCFFYLTCLHITTFVIVNCMLPLVQTISLRIWERPLALHAKCSLPSLGAPQEITLVNKLTSFFFVCPHIGVKIASLKQVQFFL